MRCCVKLESERRTKVSLRLIWVLIFDLALCFLNKVWFTWDWTEAILKDIHLVQKSTLRRKKKTSQETTIVSSKVFRSCRTSDSLFISWLTVQGLILFSNRDWQAFCKSGWETGDSGSSNLTFSLTSWFDFHFVRKESDFSPSLIPEWKGKGIHKSAKSMDQKKTEKALRTSRASEWLTVQDELDSGKEKILYFGRCQSICRSCWTWVGIKLCPLSKRAHDGSVDRKEMRVVKKKRKFKIGKRRLTLISNIAIHSQAMSNQETPSATFSSQIGSAGGSPQRRRHREQQIQSAYEIQRDAAVKGALIYTAIGASACLMAHHIFPAFRSVTRCSVVVHSGIEQRGEE